MSETLIQAWYMYNVQHEKVRRQARVSILKFVLPVHGEVADYFFWDNIKGKALLLNGFSRISFTHTLRH